MQKLTIKDVKEIFSSSDETLIQETLKKLENDNRKGVINTIKSYNLNIEKIREKELIFEKKKEFDLSFGYDQEVIAGIDEVGRGPLAGPVVAACVILKKDFIHLDIDDSKKVSKIKRKEIFECIKENALEINVGIASVTEIDELNILNATKLAMKRALKKIKSKVEVLLIDAVKIESEFKEINIIKGDEKSLAIAAASIIAKVVRDNMMEQISDKYNEYHLDKNKGYGTKEHILAIQKYGIVNNVHRKTFVKNFI